MVGLSSNDGRQRLSEKDDDEERLYDSRTTTSVRVAEDHARKHTLGDGHGIGITREFGTSIAGIQKL